MSSKDKEEQVRRYLAGAKREKTYEEKKRLKASGSPASEKRKQKKKRRASRSWLDDEDDAGSGFERIRTRSGRLDLRRSGRVPEVVEGARGGTTPDGLVLSVSRGRARVVTPEGEVQALVSPEALATASGAVVVGDEVLLGAGSEEQLLIEAVLPRRSRLARPDPARTDREKVIAANVDLAVLVVSARNPAPKLALIDRMLLAVELGGVVPLVCVNKIDLVETPEARAELLAALECYEDLARASLLVSTVTGEGIDVLRDHLLEFSTSVFVGQSGVGKSSLLNAIDPGGARRVRDVRAADGKGRHTTTGSTLVELPEGARVIDTPGIRAFGVAHLTRETLRFAFPEFAEPSSRCRFPDCRHREEPDCAVRQAAEAGEISVRRYVTYLRIWASLE